MKIRTLRGVGAYLAVGASLTFADRATFDETKTRAALFLETAPEIDGVVDPAEWELAEGGDGVSFQMGPNDDSEDGLRGSELATGDLPEDADDLSAVVYVGYDDENLYVGVKVKDLDIQTDTAAEESENEMTWLDDSIELFIDGDNSNFDARDTTGGNPEIVDTGGQYVITANNAYRGAEAGDPEFAADGAWFAKTELTDVGYDAEFRISLETIGNPQPGDIVGFSVAVNDDDDGDAAERQIIYSGLTHVENTYANLIFGGRTYSAPIAPAATIDGKIGADEYPGAEPMVVTPFTGSYHLGAGDDSFESDDHQFSAWITHDANAIYVAVEVTDDKIINDNVGEGEEDGQTWQDDSVEIFFDADDSNLIGRPGEGEQAFDGQYVYTPIGAWRDNEANNPAFGEDKDWFAAATTGEKGYICEFKVNKSALVEIKNDVPIGFNICINDDDEDTGGNREAQLNWSGRPHAEFTYGSLILSSDGVNVLPFAISSLVYSAAPTRKVTVTWPSKEGESFTVARSTDLQTWNELEDGLEAGADGATSFDDEGLGEQTHYYYQVTKEDE